MANLSDAFGTYCFDFSMTKANKAEIQQWLSELMALLGDVEYYTDFQLGSLNKEEFLSSQLSQDHKKLSLDFSGCGRWGYRCNIAWFETDEDLSSHLLKMPGLKISIDFTDGEPGCNFIEDGSCTLAVQEGEVTISYPTLTIYKYNPLNAIKLKLHDFESAMDFWEIGEEELSVALSLGDDWTYNPN